MRIKQWSATRFSKQGLVVNQKSEILYGKADRNQNQPKLFHQTRRDYTSKKYKTTFLMPESKE